MKYVVISVLVVFLSFSANAAKTEQAEVRLIAGSYENNQLTLGLHYKINPDWTIYWRTPGDAGYPPKLNWEGSKNIKSEEILWPIPKRHGQEIINNFYSESYVYEDEIIFPIIITPEDSSKPINAKLYVDFAICNEICISDSVTLKLHVKPEYNSAENLSAIQSYINKIPQENGSFGINIKDVSLSEKEDEKYFYISAHSKKPIKDPEIFIEGGQYFLFPKPEVLSSNNNSISFKVKANHLTDKQISEQEFNIVFINDGVAVERQISGQTIKQSKYIPTIKQSLLLMLLFGFIGGLILNIMPCVLPVLSIKLLGVIKYGGSSKAAVAKSFLVTAIGIISSFLTLAFFVIAAKAIGLNIGWGFHFQEPLFIIFLVVILTFFAANMWGLYEFRMPFAISDKAYKKSQENSSLGHFLTGVFATILATPCTAPFLGTAVGFAFANNSFEIITVFAAMGLGMSFPYILFSVFPSLITKLPKPGNWMVIVKQIMGLMLAATAIWLIWVLSAQIGILAALALLLLSIFKIIKLWAAKHISFLQNKALKFSILSIIVILSFIVPIKLSDSTFKTTHINENIWENFEEGHIDQLVENGKVVFVDVTADWCLTCKVNKLLVLDSDEIKQFFYKKDIVAMRADWTNKSDDIANYLMRNNRVGIPFNIVYGPGAPNGIILSELLTKKAIFSAIKQAETEKIKK